ncbi:hypothetical protein C8250_015420 [Streptomyces sp. So13.3]|uniref:hypothetical protein n=1 Tax=unclassified Streptomyces TaxID=2593676 RepID=UPI001106E12F|nr:MULTISPECIES: hypothetical protein [unclassified Streptomyces]NEA75453.1 hypothetical protein [Streptomyces sp. SID13588]QNA73120.1 hypothetical protein C8250_015420 [Streptomyces sp. So13.3]
MTFTGIPGISVRRFRVREWRTTGGRAATPLTDGDAVLDDLPHRQSPLEVHSPPMLASRESQIV